MSAVIAFRRLLSSFAGKLSDEDCRNIVFIRLYETQERYRNATALDIFSQLEIEGLFSPTKPEGLIEVAKDVKRPDLATEVEKFIKSQKKSVSREDKKANRRAAENQPQAAESDADLHLKENLVVTLAQTTVLTQRVEILKQEITALAGKKHNRCKVEKAIKEAQQTAERLVQTLKKAQSALESGNNSDSGSDRSSTADLSPTDDVDKLWGTVHHGGQQFQILNEETSTLTAGPVQETPPVSTPTPKPRIPRKPVQETGRSARTMASFVAKVHLPAMSGNPVVPIRYGPPRDSNKPQSAPSTPSIDRVTSQPTKPAILPRKSSQSPASTRLTSSRPPVPVARQQYHTMPGHADSSNNHGYLDPAENDSEELEDSTGDTGDSGFSEAEQWKRHIQHPPPPPPRLPPRHPVSDSPDLPEETHYYKSLNRSEIEVPSYDQVQHQDLLDRLTS